MSKSSTICIMEYTQGLSFHIDYFVGLTEKGELDSFDPQDASIKMFLIKDRKVVSVDKLAEIIEYINGIDGVVYIFCKDGFISSVMKRKIYR